MTPNQAHIADALRKLHQRGRDLSHNALARRNPSLVSAATYHFGSYRHACERAGLNYAEISRRPRWTKPKIIRLIKAAYRADKDLRWSAVTRRKGERPNELARAAFAAVQPRLFSSWDRALHAAGLDSADIAQYRDWDRATITSDLKQLAADNEPLNSAAILKADPGLHAAILRHFGSLAAALRSAHINPAAARLRKSWTKDAVIAELRKRKRRRLGVTDSAVRKENPALYGAALRLFGSFVAAGFKSKIR